MTIPAAVLAIAPSDPVVVLALTAIGEASDQGYNGMQAVINSVINRADHPEWWGHTPFEVCLDADQYDCWNAGPDRDRILAMSPADPVYREAVQLAKLAITGSLPDLTRGADSYYAESIEPPAWAKAETSTFTVQIGAHRYYITRPHTAAAETAPVAATPAPAPEPTPAAEPHVIDAPIPIPLTP